MDSGSRIYKTGYVPGVFDLFHVGHLNLLRRSRERCEYLIAGVLTDELVEHFKGERPYIPFEERIAIVSALRLVDEAVPVDFTNTNKMDAWNRYHFDCHFSGDDHGTEWNKALRQLQETGSNMEFFPYTQSTSSTQLKRLISKEIALKKQYLFGAGRICRGFLEFLKGQKGYGVTWEVTAILDNDRAKNLTSICGIPVYDAGFIKYILNKEDTPIIITSIQYAEIRGQLEREGFQKVIGYEEYPGYDKDKIYR